MCIRDSHNHADGAAFQPNSPRAGRGGERSVIRSVLGAACPLRRGAVPRAMVRLPEDSTETPMRRALRTQEEILARKLLNFLGCLLYTSDAADDLLCVDLGGRRIIKKKKQEKKQITNQQNTTPTHYQNREYN